MQTKLQLHDYCQGCPHIQPTADMIVAEQGNEVIISCGNSNKCWVIAHHIDQYLSKFYKR